MNTTACSGSTLSRPWRSFTAQRVSCITARASAPATSASSGLARPTERVNNPAMVSVVLQVLVG